MPYADIEKRRAYMREYRRKWRKEHPKEAKDEADRFLTKAKSFTHEQKRLKHNRARIRNKVRAYLVLGGRCRMCGETDFRLLTLNHKNGDGRKDRVRYGASTNESVYRQIRDFKRNDLELLCWNCQALFEWNRSGHWFPEEHKSVLKKELQDHKVEQDWFNEVQCLELVKEEI